MRDPSRRSGRQPRSERVLRAIHEPDSPRQQSVQRTPNNLRSVTHREDLLQPPARVPLEGAQLEKAAAVPAKSVRGGRASRGHGRVGAASEQGRSGGPSAPEAGAASLRLPARRLRRRFGRLEDPRLALRRAPPPPPPSVFLSRPVLLPRSVLLPPSVPPPALRGGRRGASTSSFRRGRWSHLRRWRRGPRLESAFSACACIGVRGVSAVASRARGLPAAAATIGRIDLLSFLLLRLIRIALAVPFVGIYCNCPLQSCRRRQRKRLESLGGVVGGQRSRSRLCCGIAAGGLRPRDSGSLLRRRRSRQRRRPGRPLQALCPPRGCARRRSRLPGAGDHLPGHSHALRGDGVAGRVRGPREAAEHVDEDVVRGGRRLREEGAARRGEWPVRTLRSHH